MGVVIAIDAGTTGIRALCVDESGLKRFISYRELTQHYPRPGWIEHDPGEIWSAVQETLSDVARDCEDAGERVVCVGITNQRETVVIWDRRTGKALYRAIVWQDRRTADRCDELIQHGHLPMIRSMTGLVLDPYFSATKIEWLLRPGTERERSAEISIGADLAIGTVDSWILWNLTGGADGGVHATDATNASRTLLCDISTLKWSEELCDLFGVPITSLPAIHPSAGRFGVIAREALGKLAGLPVSGIAGDQQAALFGQACFHPGMVKATHGTGSFVLMNIGGERPTPVEGLLTTVAWDLGSSSTQSPGSVAYALEGAAFASGAAIQWLRDGLGIISDAHEMEPLATSVPDSDGVYIVPAFAGLGSPWWDPYARGAIVGLSRGSTGAHLARAVVDSIAFQTRDIVEAMSAGVSQPISQLRVDGGASAIDILLQLQADQLQVPVARAGIAETTAVGAAWLSGLAEGVWGSLEDLETLWAFDAKAQPNTASLDPALTSGAQAIRDRHYEGWIRAIDRSRGWARPTRN